MSSNSAVLLAEIQQIARDPSRRVFTLVDGAQFDDLPGALVAAGISHRSLYRNVQNAELVRAGPWLIDPYRQPNPLLNAWGGLPPESGGEGESAIAADTRAALNDHYADLRSPENGSLESADPGAQLEAVIRLIGDAPAAVFWISDSSLSEAALWRHLRTLNMVLIPKEYDAPDESGPLEGEGTHEAMMFRHADGNVLAEVMPALDAAQFSRVFGPAQAVMFLAPDHPGPGGSLIRRAVLPDNAPAAQPGLLKLSMEQMQDIEEMRCEASRHETVKFLRENAAEETAHLSEAQLYEEVVEIEARGFALGFESTSAHNLFAFMCVTGCAAAVEGEEFAQYVEKSGIHPDDAISGVFDGMISAAEADVRGAL